jgi:serine/threonine protein kinase
MGDRTGQQLGNYRLLRSLGRGGFAEVYLGEHVHLKTLAAIKVLHTQMTPESQQAFLQEARTIATLEHPNIVRLLEYGIEETLPFLVMSYASNGTVRQRYPHGAVLPVCQNGTFFLSLLQNNGIEQTLQQDTFSAAIQAGVKQTNTLAVLARGTELMLYVNYQQLATVTDATYSQGQVGVGAFPVQSATEVAYGHARVWTL